MLRIKILALLLWFSYNSTTAAHIIGGDVTYTCIGSNAVTQKTTFRVTFTMYRDVAGNGAPFDQIARFGIYERDLEGTLWTHRQTIVSNPIRRAPVPYEDECVVVPTNILVEKANYIFDIELPWSSKVFQITYQRCCRNNTISNIVNPGGTGAAFYVEIYGNAIEECNNSPVFNKFPPILICNQKMLNFDHSASDSEGNRLEYEFCAPLHAGGTDGATTPGSALSCTGVTPLPDNCPPPYNEVVFGPNYSAGNPMGGSPQITIDRVTGIISGIPNLQGQFVVGVCVKEFKNGVQIGSIRRDFQFNVVNCQGISETKNYNLCEGDSILVNQTYYHQPGTYVQQFESISGCDSTVNIIIKGLKKSGSQLYYKLCDEETVSIHGKTYTSSGVFTQVLVNKAGCDSTLTIAIDKFRKSESDINIQLCDQETGIVNGIVYENAGNFTQILSNVHGCDSIIHIQVKKGMSTFEEKTFSLCDQNPVVVNGQTYLQPGKYVSRLMTSNGCDSVLNIIILPCDQNILFDLEKCDALTPEKSMIFDEFLPVYIKKLDEGKIIASNIHRDNPQMNKHSCTPGFNHSKAMCVSASSSCNHESADVTPIVITFVVIPESGKKIQFNHLIFQQMSPLQYNWISGATGQNNYPTKYGIKIFKNGTEIYRKADITANNTWSREKYDFFDNDIFSSVDSAAFRIELLPYCPVGNGSLVSVWDIDDVVLYFSGADTDNRSISGKIMNLHPELSGVEIRRQFQLTQKSTLASNDGSFLLPENDVSKDYIFKAYHNENTILGITTLDLVLIQRHILGLDTFTHPLQFLAADVNNDQKVTASDLVHLRKIILGIDEYFRKNTSWLFLDELSMKIETNPWAIKRHIDVPSGNHDLDDLRFVALKVGDVDGARDVYKIEAEK